MNLKVFVMRSSQNILNLAKIKPEYMGFIFWKHSKRFVSNSTPDLGEGIKKVGVFVNARSEYIKKWIEAHKLKAVQIHGNERHNKRDELQKIDGEVIKAFAIQKNVEFRERVN